MNIYQIIGPETFPITCTITENNNTIDSLEINSTKVKNGKCDAVTNYLNGNSKSIPLKYNLSGTPFQIKVWNEILKIPYGETSTYSEISQKIGMPKAYRAVANACGDNKLALIVPCHRVVGKSHFGGYKWGIDIKRKLLELEIANMDK